MTIADYSRWMRVILVEEIVSATDWPEFRGLLPRGRDGTVSLRRWVAVGDSGVEVGGRADVWAWVLPLNPLDEGDADRIVDVINMVEPGARLVVWSGTLGDGLFDTAPANWLGVGFEALNAFAKRVRDDLISRGVRLLFLPHARHILSDGPVCLKFMREQSGGNEGEAIDKIETEGCPFGIALSPVLLMEPSMVADSEDHIRRIVEVVGPLAEVIIFEDGYIDVVSNRIVTKNCDTAVGVGDGPVWLVDWEKVRMYLQEMERGEIPIVGKLSS